MDQLKYSVETEQDENFLNGARIRKNVSYLDNEHLSYRNVNVKKAESVEDIDASDLKFLEILESQPQKKSEDTTEVKKQQIPPVNIIKTRDESTKVVTGPQNTLSKNSGNNRTIIQRDQFPQNKSPVPKVRLSDAEPQVQASQLYRLREKNPTNDSGVKKGFAMFRKANFIKKAMQAFLKLSPSKQFKKLNPIHFSIIGDCSYFPENLDNIKDDNFSDWQNIAQQNNEQQEESGLWFFKPVDPNGKFAIIFEILLIIVLLIFAYTTILEIAFSANIIPPAIHYTIYSFLIASILVSLNKGFYNQDGELVMKRSKILRHYFSTRILQSALEILSVLVYLNDNIFVIVIASLRVLEVLRIYYHLDEVFQIQQRFYTVSELIKLLVLIFIVSHYCACGFYYVGTLEVETGWISRIPELAQNFWYIRYLNAIYYSFITMVTIGYGDIVPVTSKEKLYVVCIIFMCCGIFAYAINCVGSIFHEKAQRDAEYKKQRASVQHYLQERDIERSLQIRVLKYFEFFFSKQQELSNKESGEKILSQLSTSMQNEVLSDFYGKILRNIEILNLNFSKKLISQLSHKLNEISLGPGEELIKAGDINHSLYYVRKGQLQLHIERDGHRKVLGHIASGAVTGVQGFFCSKQIAYSLRSIGITSLIAINQKEFLELARQFPNDYQKYCMIRDRIRINKEHIGGMCPLCERYTHNIDQCNLVQFAPDLQFVLGRHHVTSNQERAPSQRRLQSNFNTLQENENVRLCLRQHRVTLIANCYSDSKDQLDQEVIKQLLEFAHQNNVSDREFYRQVPPVRVIQDQVEVLSDNEDDNNQFDDSEYEKNNTQHSGSNMTSSSNGSYQGKSQKMFEIAEVQSKPSKYSSNQLNEFQNPEFFNFNSEQSMKPKSDGLIVRSPKIKDTDSQKSPQEQKNTQIKFFSSNTIMEAKNSPSTANKLLLDNQQEDKKTLRENLQKLITTNKNKSKSNNSIQSQQEEIMDLAPIAANIVAMKNVETNIFNSQLITQLPKIKTQHSNGLKNSLQYQSQETVKLSSESNISFNGTGSGHEQKLSDSKKKSSHHQKNSAERKIASEMVQAQRRGSVFSIKKGSGRRISILGKASFGHQFGDLQQTNHRQNSNRKITMVNFGLQHQSQDSLNKLTISADQRINTISRDMASIASISRMGSGQPTQNFFASDYDKMQEFIAYFPQNNYSAVLRELRKKKIVNNVKDVNKLLQQQNSTPYSNNIQTILMRRFTCIQNKNN